jgi:hypothetical protein
VPPGLRLEPSDKVSPLPVRRLIGV